MRNGPSVFPPDRWTIFAQCVRSIVDGYAAEARTTASPSSTYPKRTVTDEEYRTALLRILPQSLASDLQQVVFQVLEGIVSVRAGKRRVTRLVAASPYKTEGLSRYDVIV